MKSLFLSLFVAAMLVACGGSKPSAATEEVAAESEVVVMDSTSAMASDSLTVVSEMDSTSAE